MFHMTLRSRKGTRRKITGAATSANTHTTKARRTRGKCRATIGSPAATIQKPATAVEIPAAKDLKMLLAGTISDVNTAGDQDRVAGIYRGAALCCPRCDGSSSTPQTTAPLQTLWEISVPEGGSKTNMVWDSVDCVWWLIHRGEELTRDTSLLRLPLAGTAERVVCELRRPRQLTDLAHDSRRDVIVLATDDAILSAHGQSGLIVVSKSGRALATIASHVMSGISGVTYCGHGDVYVTCYSSLDHVSQDHSVCLFSASTGELLRTVGRSEADSEGFQCPAGITHNPRPEPEPEGGCVIVADHINDKLKFHSREGDLVKRVGRSDNNTLHACFSSPAGVCADPRGRVIICDVGNCRVVRYDPDLDRYEVLLTRDQILGEPTVVSLSGDGSVLVVGHSQGVLRACTM